MAVLSNPNYLTVQLVENAGGKKKKLTSRHVKHERKGCLSLGIGAFTIEIGYIVSHFSAVFSSYGVQVLVVLSTAKVVHLPGGK